MWFLPNECVTPLSFESFQQIQYAVRATHNETLEEETLVTKCVGDEYFLIQFTVITHYLVEAVNDGTLSQSGF